MKFKIFLHKHDFFNYVSTTRNINKIQIFIDFVKNTNKKFIVSWRCCNFLFYYLQNCSSWSNHWNSVSVNHLLTIQMK
jgi:hypothetical protein